MSDDWLMRGYESPGTAPPPHDADDGYMAWMGDAGAYAYEHNDKDGFGRAAWTAALRSLPAAPKIPPTLEAIADALHYADAYDSSEPNVWRRYGKAVLALFATLPSAPDEPKRCEHGYDHWGKCPKCNSAGFAAEPVVGHAPDSEVPQTFDEWYDTWEMPSPEEWDPSDPLTKCAMDAWNAALRSMKGAEK